MMRCAAALGMEIWPVVRASPVSRVVCTETITILRYLVEAIPAVLIPTRRYVQSR